MSLPSSPYSEHPPDSRIPFREAVWVWAQIGFLSFGGPAGQIALMHRELVEKRRWLDEGRFLHALSYCMLLPGPEAQQLAIYVGWLMHRARGGIVAGVLFVLPGSLMVLGLSALYASLGQVSAVAALFFGLKAAVLALVIEAVRRLAKRALKTRLHTAIAAAAFLALFLLHLPFPLVIGLAALVGLAAERSLGAEQPRAPEPSAGDTVVERMLSAGELRHTLPSRRKTLRALVVGLAAWWIPLLALRLSLGEGSVLYREGVFFSEAAMITFGGAYAALSFVAERAVHGYGWLQPGEMLDGLGLAETTPGPLILVLEFVGFLAAYRNPGSLSPMLAGVLGALTTLWATFAPCFLWIFVGAPHIEALRGQRWLRAALSAITAAVVGVILELSIWFGSHVLFRELSTHELGPLSVQLPVPASVDLAAVALAGTALLALFRFELGAPKTLGLIAFLGLCWKLLAG